MDKDKYKKKIEENEAKDKENGIHFVIIFHFPEGKERVK